MSKYLSMSDIYAMPSQYDASPKALNEAMNFKLPILVSDGVKTAKELCKDGVNGFIFSVGDVNSLSEHISSFNGDRSTVTSMGEASELIVGQFNYDTVTDAWVDAIEYSINKE